MAKQLGDYEDLNQVQYAELDVNQLVLNSPENTQLKEDMLNTIENLRNPYTDLYHWVKGEIYDLNAYFAALQIREKVKAALDALKKKNQNTQKDIESLNAGKKTMTTVFKKPEDVGTMTNKIASRSTDIEYQERLLDVLTVYLGGILLQEFKQEKLGLYKRIVSQFHVLEIGNSHSMAMFWSKMLENPLVKSSAGKEVPR